jgi:hypothetical protein
MENGSWWVGYVCVGLRNDEFRVLRNGRPRVMSLGSKHVALNMEVGGNYRVTRVVAFPYQVSVSAFHSHTRAETGEAFATHDVSCLRQLQFT